MSDKPAPDWEKIEGDYRAGLLSIREIAGQHGITDGAIRKRAKAQDWVRDLSKKIQAKADALVRTQTVRSEVRSQKELSECVLVNGVAQAIADVRLNHRGDIRRYRQLTNELAQELEFPPEDLDLPKRIDCAKKLSDTLKTLIGLEREAYDISQDADKAQNQPCLDADLDLRIAELERKAGR